MSLPEPQLNRICDAIRAAYTPENLGRMVRTQLNERLYDVPGGEDFRAVVFHLVEWADRQGRLPELIHAALAENPDNPDLAAVAASAPLVPPGRAHPAAPGPWYMPFEQNRAFFGRTEDLQRLHAALTPHSRERSQAVVGIRLAGVTGMGGMGKTQLAVEYAYRYRAEYPGGVFWLNAAGDWRAEFAGLGVYLDPSCAGEPQEIQLRAAVDYFQAHPACLLVLDNVEEPQQLRRPLTRFLVPSALPCAVLFTTRRHDLGAFRLVELPVLPEGPGLQLLLRHPSRQAVLAENHAEYGEALRIYAMLGGLPLALEIAGAHLGRRPAASLAAYRQELLRRGALAVVDDARGGVREEELGTRHAAAVAATLAEQWEGLGEDARLFLRAAGLLPEAAAIPLARVGLLVGIKEGGGDFFSDLLGDAAQELMNASLLENLRGNVVRLHPLVRAFANQQTAAADREGFRWECAARLIVAYDDLAVLEAQCALRGIDAVEQDLLDGLGLLGDAKGSDQIGASAALLLRAARQESHTLRGWNAGQYPALFREQWLKRALLLGEDKWVERVRSFLQTLSCPHLEVTWTTAQSGPSLVRTLNGHTGYVNAASLTPDGHYAISGSGDRTLRVWSLATGETVRILSGHAAWVRAVTVTPDGLHAVSGSDDGTLRVWDMASGETVLVLSGHDSRVHTVAVTSSGERVLSGSSDRTLRVWDIATGETVRILIGHTGPVHAVAVTPDGRHAISGSQDNTLRVWNIASGETVLVLSGHTGPVHAVAVTPDGRHAISGSRDNTLRVWDLTSGQTVHILSGHVGYVNALAVTPNGRHGVSGSGDKTLRVWDLATGETVSIFSGHAGPVYAVVVTPDGRCVISGLYDKTLQVWDLTGGDAINSFNRHAGRVNTVTITPDGRYAVSGSTDRTLRVWDLNSGETVHTLNSEPSNGVYAVAVVPDGPYAVSGSSDHRLRIWDLNSGNVVRTLSRHTRKINGVVVTLDGCCAVSGSDDGTLRVWDLASGDMVRILRGHTREVYSIALTPDGRHAVSGSGDNTLRVWDLAKGETVSILNGHTAGVFAVAAMPDSRHIISGSHDKTAKVWDLITGQAVHTLYGHSRRVHAVAVTRDGRYAITGSSDHTLRVWDLASGVEEARLELDAAVGSAAIVAHTYMVVAGDAAGNLWRLRYRASPVAS